MGQYRGSRRLSEYQGNLIATGMKMAVVVSRFNEFITERLLEGAQDCFVRHGGDAAHLDVVRVPGAYELPVAAKKLAERGGYDAIVVVGAVIRGATPHFDYVSSAATSGLSTVSLEHGLPVGFGLLTTDTVDQAVERAGSKAGNKGAEAMATAIEMANLLKQLG